MNVTKLPFYCEESFKIGEKAASLDGVRILQVLHICSLRRIRRSQTAFVDQEARKSKS